MTENDKQAIYERASMDNRVGYGDEPVLLVVDLQTGFTDPENPLGGDLTDVVARTDRLVGAAHDGDVPVVFTRIVTKHDDMRDLGVWSEKIPSLETLHVDGEWVDLDPRLDVREEDHVLDKQQASAFHGTELNTMLAYFRADTVVVTGCTTSGCIRASAVDACSHGYYTIVPEDAVGDRAVDPHEANLFDINAKYGDVRPVEEVAGYLESGGAQPPGGTN
jgi:maleamate amidohydrolase